MHSQEATATRQGPSRKRLADFTVPIRPLPCARWSHSQTVISTLHFDYGWKSRKTAPRDAKDRISGLVNRISWFQSPGFGHAYENVSDDLGQIQWSVPFRASGHFLKLMVSRRPALHFVAGRDITDTISVEFRPASGRRSRDHSPLRPSGIDAAPRPDFSIPWKPGTPGLSQTKPFDVRTVGTSRFRSSRTARRVDLPVDREASDDEPAHGPLGSR